MNTTILSAVTFVYLASFVVFLVSEATGKGTWEKAARFITLGGFLVHTGGIVLRWVESHQAGMGHAPLSNFYESLVFFSWAVVFLYLSFAWKQAKGIIGAFVMPVAFLLMAYASFSPTVDSQIKPLIPALKSNWLIVHVITCFLGYAAFVLASVFGIMSLRQGDDAARTKAVAEMLENCLKTGFILFTLGIVTGSVWAHVAWGRYWGWDPKETWALITWLIYTGAIHVRIRDGSMSRRFVAILVIGLAAVLFTYFGVNYLPGLHSYQ
ncbi:MAG: cytochrome c biogenesis protein CcsA [Desulfobacterota bacterium]|nr:cytochrome c biogenesis protein CcsA [Thermodesulfobacteriota bacterium]